MSGIIDPRKPLGCNHAGFLVPTVTKKHTIILQLPEQAPRRQEVQVTIITKCFNCGVDINSQPPPELSQEELDKYP